MSARECPANDWPRVTVNTPTTAEVMATTVPTASATCTGPLPKKPGSKTYLHQVTHGHLDDAWRPRRWHLRVGVLGPLRGGHHQDPPVHPDHVDVLAVQAGQDLGLDHLVGAADRDPAAGHVDDPVHHRHQRVHVVRRSSTAIPSARASRASTETIALLAGDVQVGQRLVEQQQPGPADQGVRDHDPLLLAAGQLADPCVGVPLRADGGQHVGDQLAASPGRQPDAELVPVDARARPRP